MCNLDTYLNGNTIEVYNELIRLADKDYITVLPEAEKVFFELFKRVKYNLEIIYAELEQIGYKFWQNPEYDFQKPLLPPVSQNDLSKKLLELESRKLFMPLSLQCFYKYVGACNFGWDYKNYPDIPWEYSDPIQICPLPYPVDSFIDHLVDYEKRGKEYYDGFDDFLNINGLEISADYYHKDNVSGGAPYSVQITQKPSIDSLLLHEENNGTFINYLRVCFDNCGFSRAYELKDNNEFLAFCNRVKPKLVKI